MYSMYVFVLQGCSPLVKQVKNCEYIYEQTSNGRHSGAPQWACKSVPRVQQTGMVSGQHKAQKTAGTSCSALNKNLHT